LWLRRPAARALWAGCTHNSTRTLVRQAGKLKQIRGLDAVLSANPYYNKPRKKASFSTFWLWRRRWTASVALYNVPGRTAVNLDPETVVRLAAAASNIQASRRQRQGAPDRRTGSHAAQRLQDFLGRRQYGAGGDRRGRARTDQRASNEIPAEVSRMVRAALNNNWPRLVSWNASGTTFDANFWESNPAPVKAVLAMMAGAATTCACRWFLHGRDTRRLERLAGELGLLKK